MADLAADLARIYPPDRLLTRAATLAPYESDGLTAFRARPRAVVLAESKAEVVQTVRLCHAAGVPFVARGSGTSLSGGSVPLEDGIVIALNRMNRILRVEPVDRLAVVEPGVINLDISAAGEPHGLYYAPDPVEPVGVHHRRQRRLQLRRRALLPPRHDRQSRAGPRGRAARRRGGAAGRRQRRGGRARSHRPVRRIRGAVRRRRRDHRAPDSPARGLSHGAGLLRLAPGGGRRGDPDHRRRTAAGRDGDHGPPGHRSRRGRGARRLSARRGRRAAGRARRRPRRRPTPSWRS